MCARCSAGGGVFQYGVPEKRRFPLFSGAWDRALSRAGEGLMAVAYKRAGEGKETIIIRGSQEVERRITPSDAILGVLLKRGS